jgi:hypothetical protein
MFNRINTGGTKLNEAEIRRGSLPGAFTDLVIELASLPAFVDLTPISEKLINEREREELVVRFFTYLDRIEVAGGALDLPGWKDRPREYIWSYVRSANARAAEEPNWISERRQEFVGMLQFVEHAFPNGFKKSPTANQIPRVRFEAISVGSALAIQAKPDLAHNPPKVDWAEDGEFLEVTTSDAANVKSKLLRRIGYVFDRLTA